MPQPGRAAGSGEPRLSQHAGRLLAQVGRYPESLDCFVRSSGDALGHYRLARTLQHLQQPELSRQYLELALQKNPNLAMAQAMRTEMDGPPNAPNPANLATPPNETIQRTSYQEPSAPVEPATPVIISPPADTPLPQIINLNSSTANAAETVEDPAEEPFILPPPPSIDMHYDASADNDGKKH